MIEFDRVSVTYSGASQPAIREVSLRIEEGELALVVGRTGSGKSTLLGAINGLVPHFTGGTLAGTVTVDGRTTSSHPPRELADVVGVVGQDPLSGFVTDTVEEELAYGMEQLAVRADVMRKRVEETLDLLGIADLRNRPLAQLSGGQQQRVAIGSVVATHPRVLVLDEPTSALDPNAAEEVLAAITRLVHDLGVTVVLAEHRLERVVQYADRVIEVRGDRTVREGAPADHARGNGTCASGGRARPPGPLGSAATVGARRPSGRRPAARDRSSHCRFRRVDAWSHGNLARSRCEARRLVVRYGPVIAVREVDLDLVGGEVTALMGRNGSGKSSLLWALQGSGPRQAGSVAVGGVDPASLSPARARALVGLVPQSPADLLYLDSVEQECEQADHESGTATPGATRQLLDRLAPGIPPQMHPRDLSEGQRLSLVLAVQLAAAPEVLLLDEPTRGLDYPAKRSFVGVLERLAGAGHSVVVSTHDVEFAAMAADRVVVMAEGDIVADGPVAEIMVASPSFAPQVAKILAPLEYLTIDQVQHALSAAVS